MDMNIKKRLQDEENFGDVKYYYDNIYKQLNTGKKSFISRFLIHSKVESAEDKKEGVIRLELGGGSGQHFQFLKDFNQNHFKMYITSDINLGSIQSIERNFDHNLEVIQIDAQELPFKNNSIDQIISTCVIGHLNDPEKALIEIQRVLKEGGICSFIVPLEPSFLLNMVRRIYQIPAARRLGFEGYELMVAREHRYNWQYLIRVVNHVFRHEKVKVRFIPFLVPVGGLNLSIVMKIYKS